MTLSRLVYIPRYIACYTLIAIAIPVVAGIFALIAILGTLALAGDFVRVRAKPVNPPRSL